MERLSRPIRSVFAAAVALTLAFGASQAFAGPPAVRAVAACTDESCQMACESIFPGQAVFGACDIRGRCRCLFEY
ncbi:MAG TPA: hypothetical protein VF615_14195 [Longimicrobiaceae bacterium]|jgi:hypothetical protein